MIDLIVDVKQYKCITQVNIQKFDRRRLAVCNRNACIRRPGMNPQPPSFS